MRSAIVAAALAVVLFASCQRDPVASSSAIPAWQEKAAVPGTGSKVIKVKVTAGGDVTADGQPVTVEQLATKLADLKAAGGDV